MTKQTSSTPVSKLDPRFMEGTIIISGLQGLGKTELAVTLEHPKLTAFFDYDLKGEGVARAYGIDQYFAPNFIEPDKEITDFDALRLAEWTLQKIKEIRLGTTVVLFDNATFLEDGLKLIVAKDPRKYGVRPDNVQKGAFGGPNPGVSILWSSVVNYLQRHIGVKNIEMCVHMTQPWANGAPVPNRFHVKGNKVFRQLSVLSVIMTPGDATRGGVPPIPSALVIKESMALRRYDESTGEHEQERAFPQRFPVARWTTKKGETYKSILGYFGAPADFKNPAIGETWTEFEINAYGEFLSKEQLTWIKEAANIKYSEDGGTESGTATTVETKKPVVSAPSLTPKQRFLAELKQELNVSADVIARAMGVQKYEESKHEALKAHVRMVIQKERERNQTELESLADHG